MDTNKHKVLSRRLHGWTLIKDQRLKTAFDADFADFAEILFSDTDFTDSTDFFTAEFAENAENHRDIFSRGLRGFSRIIF